jgi:hypothetical protein
MMANTIDFLQYSRYCDRVVIALLRIKEMAYEKRAPGVRGAQRIEKAVTKKIPYRRQFKCRTCDKVQSCYGSRYCQNEFNPVSLVAHCSKK